MRSEVIAPFRAVRMFFYGAFMASGGIGGLIAITRLIASLNNAPGAEAPIEIAKGLAIDFGAVIVFALLYRWIEPRLTEILSHVMAIVARKYI